MATLAQQRNRAIPAARISRVLVLAVVLILALAVVMTWGLLLGTPQLSLNDLGVIANGGGERVPRIVVTQIRLPRVLLGASAGAMLALAGAMLQGSLRNGLGGPELLGVSAGASVVIAAVTIFHLPLDWGLYPWVALAGGMLAGTIV